MSFKNALDQGVLFVFIPKPLEIADRPELSLLPFNVMFAKYKIENGKTIMGSSLYEPDLASFCNDGRKYTMQYHNIYGGNNWLLMEYDLLQKSYLGEKTVNGERIGMATGMNWKMFFFHFTALGLTNGEACLFSNAK